MALVARSKVHLQMGENQKALQDAEVSLKEDKEFVKVVLLRSGLRM